jgi:hypothetical protein
MTETDYLDVYACGVDDFSETEIVEAVNHLNYLIDNLIADLLVINYNFSSSSSTGSREVFKPVSGGVLHSSLEGWCLSEGEVRDLIVEFFLRDMILASVYTQFFEGEVFSGVGSGSLQESLEVMMEKLSSGGES